MDAMSHSANVAFRKLGYVAAELLDCLTESRAGAARKFQTQLPFDWKTAAEKLQMLDDGLSFYLKPVNPALRKATPGKMMTVAEVDGKTALHVLQKLTSNTIRAFWTFLNMTGKGAKKLVIPRHQRNAFEETGLLASIAALSQSEVRELRKHLEREIDDAHEAALADTSRHPGEVAKSWFGDEEGLDDGLKEYWSKIGYEPEHDTESGDADPIEDVLTGQLLPLYRYLKTRKRRTSFDSLAKLKNCWRNDEPSEDAIVKALKRLQKELNKIPNCPTSLVVEAKNRRTYLDK